MMYKANIGDFPLKDYPCKYWWVRYAVVCTYFSESYRKMWGPRIEELEKQYGFNGIGYQGIFDLRECRTKKLVRAYMDRKIFVWKNKKRTKVDSTSDLFQILDEFIKNQPHWISCPYERGEQSKCPFYEPSDFYTDQPLEELRKRKGYNIS